MKRLLLAGAVMAAACSPQPAAVRVAEHHSSAEPEGPGSTGSAAGPTTVPAAGPTTVPAAGPTTVRRTTTTELASPQSRTTGRGSEPPGNDRAYGEWEIPAYIVMCESGGSWTAENASGAGGPYQLMPEHFGGVSALNQTRAAQHAMAKKLWAGGRGARNWKDCL